MTTKVEKQEEVSRPLRKPPEARKFSLHEFKMELKRIEWPSRKEVVKSTGTVLIILIIFVIFVVAIDAGISQFINIVQVAR